MRNIQIISMTYSQDSWKVLDGHYEPKEAEATEGWGSLIHPRA